MSPDPSDRWREAADNYSKVCKGILAVSQSIRYVGVLNRYGRTVTGFIRPGTRPMLDREQAKNEFFVLSAILRLSAEAETAIGRLEHILVRHEKIKMALIPFGNVACILTIDGEESQYMQVVRDVKAHLNKMSS
ncbi:MAG: hypothetical protein J4G04_08055 [Nitrosopumilaceae archaeon]|nr:hypothetical protein [Nitrosopumilaceae archaeon]